LGGTVGPVTRRAGDAPGAAGAFTAALLDGATAADPAVATGAGTPSSMTGAATPGLLAVVAAAVSAGGDFATATSDGAPVRELNPTDESTPSNATPATPSATSTPFETAPLAGGNAPAGGADRGGEIGVVFVEQPLGIDDHGSLLRVLKCCPT
jgi:hypothetical protein